MRQGSRVRQKAGLNRVILATGWAELRRMLSYKAGRLVAVDPAWTSRTCHACGHVDAGSRRTRSEFQCTACGHADHADANAARNIRRQGLALLHGEVAGLPGRRTVNTQERQHDTLPTFLCKAPVLPPVVERAGVNDPRGFIPHADATVERTVGDSRRHAGARAGPVRPRRMK